MPKLLLITRKDYGGSYLAMCSRDLGADMAFAWPTAEIAVMGAAGAANIIHRKEIKEAKDPGAKRKEKIQEYEALFSNPYRAANRGYIDAIIERTRLSELAEHQRLQPQNSLSNISELVYECIETSTNPARIQAQVGFALEANTDAGLLTIIIANLIDNALKYAPADQPVELSLEHAQSALLLRIRNPVGTAGMPDAEQLFSKFYRGTTAHSQSGSGLGLYLAHHLAPDLMTGARLVGLI